jgi:transposase
MTESKRKIGRRQYTEEFELEAVRLADSVGINAAADRLGVPRATVGNWARRRRRVALPLNGTAATAVAPSGAGALKRPAAEVEGENARLRRELASLKLDNEILRKAAAYFARESR